MDRIMEMKEKREKKVNDPNLNQTQLAYHSHTKRGEKRSHTCT